MCVLFMVAAVLITSSLYAQESPIDYKELIAKCGEAIKGAKGYGVKMEMSSSFTINSKVSFNSPLTDPDIRASCVWVEIIISVAGAVQLFKRECFLSTDGFSPMEFGGEDAAIEIEARMNGWRVRTFPEIEVIHYGYVGMGSGSRLKARLKYGKMCYMLGYHPFFQIMRLLMRIIEKPVLIGSIAELSGFVRAKCEFKKPALKPNVVHFLRREQLGRLFSTAKRKSVGINT